MINRVPTIIIGLIIVVGVGLLVYNKKQDSLALPADNTNTPATTSPAPSPAPSPVSPLTPNPSPISPSPTPSTPSGITMSVVATHNTRTSCWAVINNGVYDLTSWIPNHPGGEAAILNLCGKNGTQGFTGQHGEDEKPRMVLAGFKIGTLAQ